MPVALVAILLLAAMLYTWNIAYSGLSAYYASSARSMSLSWPAFAFGAMDPAATTTLDKLSGFLVPQALSIRLFGFHAWALTLPQAIEGVITVFAGYVIGTRWRGAVSGLCTALVMTTTPMLAAMFGKPMEDGMLTMAMALAFVAWQHAALTGRARWLGLVALWVAVGFQAKMLQAWLILPAFAVGYFIAAGAGVRQRLLRIVVAGGVTAILSLAWIGTMQLVPAHDRPYFDGSTNNNAFSMVFGYNGADRLIADLIPGSVPQLDAAAIASHDLPTRTTATSLAGHSVAKLVLPQFTTQIGWLYPAVIAGAVFGLLAVFRRQGSRAERATVVALLLSLVVPAVVLSVAFVPHATYFAVIALPLALLAVAGAGTVIERFRAGSWRPLVVLIAAQASWGTVVIAAGPTVFRWAFIIVISLAAIAVVAARRGGSRALRVAIAAAIASALFGPVLWSACVIGPGGAGSASDAYAGPRPPAVAGEAVAASPAPKLRAPFASRPDSTLSASQRRLAAYIESQPPARSWFFATDTNSIAESFILYSNHPVVPMGGFSGQAPNPTLGQIKSAVATSKVRFILLSKLGLHKPNRELSSVRNWVISTCTPTISGSFEDGFSSEQVLYDCSQK